jgi:hypothetical protein
MVMKKITLLLMIFLLAGCGAAKTAPTLSPSLLPVEVLIDPISDTRAILKYERGEGIEDNGAEKADEAITAFCKGAKHKVLVGGERLSCDNKQTRIIVFECEGEATVNVPAPVPPGSQP